MASRPLLLDMAAQHGPVTAAVSAAAAGAAATAVTDWAGSPVWIVPLATVVIAVVAGGVGIGNNLTLLSAGYRAACWLTAGWWSWYARTHEAQFPYLAKPVAWWANPSNWYIGVVLCVVGALSAGTLAFRQRRAEDRAAAAALREARERLAANSENAAIADLVERALAEQCAIGRIEPITDPETKKQLRHPVTGEPLTRVVGGATVRAVEHWTDEDGNRLGTGYTVDGDMPLGKTYEHVTNVKGMVSHLNLARGCGFEIDEGNNGRRSFIMKVQLRDGLKEDIPYPQELLEPHSAEGDTPFGKEVAGRRLAVPMRYDNVTLAGPPDAGKTNTINVLGLWDATAIDAILIDYDLSKTLSVPYVEDWLIAQLSGDPQRMAAVPQPCVGISAPNLPIAWLVSTLQLASIAERKSGYRKLMRDSKLPIAPHPSKGGVPLLRARIDEGGAFADGSYLGQLVRKNVEQIEGLGRPAAERGLWCGLRGVDKYIPTDVATLSRTRIALRPDKVQELGLYLGWDGIFPDLKKVQNKGSGYLKMGADTPLGFKTFRVGDDQVSTEQFVRQACVRASRWQPVLDPITEAVFNRRTELIADPEVAAFFRGQPGVEEDENGVLTITDFWTNRWKIVLPVMFPDYADEIRELYGEETVAAGATATTTTTTAARPKSTGGAPVKPTLTGAMNGLNVASENLANASTNLEKAVEEAKRRDEAGLPPEYSLLNPPASQPDQGGADGGDSGSGPVATVPTQPTEPPAAAEDVDTSWIPESISDLPDGWQHKDLTAPAPEPGKPSPLVAAAAASGPDAAEQRLMLLGYVIEAGEEGIRARDLRLRLQSELQVRWQIVKEFSDNSFYKDRMGLLRKLELIHQPFAPGEDADPLEPGTSRQHNYVATPKGLAYYEREMQNR